ncbi:MAG: threonine/serine exporter family protein [Acidobacteriota bacterium]
MEKESIDFLLKLGRALHTYGSAANRLEDVLDQVSSKLGCEGQFFSTPTSIFAAFGSDGEQRTYLIRVEPGEVDLGRLSDLNDIVIDVLRGSCTTAQGAGRIDKILEAGPRYGPVLDVLSFGAISAAGGVFLGGGQRELLVSTALGVLIGLLWLSTRNSPAFGRVFTPVAALIASMLATLATKWLGGYSVLTATLAGLLVLVPGLMLTVAMRELSTKHLSSGTARLSGAFVVFLELIFGVALGTRLASLMIERLPSGRHLPLPWWAEYLALLVAPLALTVRLRAHPRDAPLMVLAGILAVTGSRFGSYLLDPQLGVFVGAVTIGVASNLYARTSNRPSLIPWVPGLLLLVPGSVGFRSLTSLMDSDVVLGVETAFKMILIAVALVAGTLIANVIISPRKLS